MKRNAVEHLIQWKKSVDRKPLILKGARQVGKTWLMKFLGETEYENYYFVRLRNGVRIVASNSGI